MSSEKKRIYLSPPHMCGKELELVTKAFESNWIAPVGPDITAFENEICEYTGANTAVALSSGSAALHLALILNEIEQDDEVLCSSFTFAASAFPIKYQRATPVFVDCDKNTWCMDPELLETAIKDRISRGRKPKACIPVHLYGNCADMDPIVEICGKYEISLIEDAAESLGAIYKGRHSGTIASLGVFSFNGNKIITTSGGGMLVGQDKHTIEKARFLAMQARDDFPYYQHSTIGFNYRMSNIVAAIGRGQLSVIEDKVNKKRAIYARYKEILSNLKGIAFMPQNQNSRDNCWLTCITIDPEKTGFTNEDLRLALEKDNIESRPLWKPMHIQPVFAEAPSYTNGTSEQLFQTGLCLPSGTNLSDEDFDRIIAHILSLSSAR